MMLKITVLVCVSLCFVDESLNAAAAPSVTTIQQQEPNPAPVPEHHLRFPSGRTKNSDPEAEGDYSVCFPYFLSQDIESLLAQAVRMLDRVADDGQKRWLLAFVQKLDSLSQQLRSLPVKHRNMCFQQNHQHLDDDGLSYEDEGDVTPEVIPDNSQLHNARDVFDDQSSRQKNGHHEQYVMGKVFDSEPADVEEYRDSKRFHAKDHHQHDLESEKIHDIPRVHALKEAEGQVPAPNQRTEPNIDSDRSFDETNPLDREMVPSVRYKPASPMAYENIPFLPRSTRKGLPQMLADKLRYHPYLSRGTQQAQPSAGHPQPESQPPATRTETISERLRLAGLEEAPTAAAVDQKQQQRVTENHHDVVQQLQPSPSAPSGNQMDRPIAGTDKYEMPPKTSISQSGSDLEKQTPVHDTMKSAQNKDENFGKKNLPESTDLQTSLEGQIADDATKNERHLGISAPNHHEDPRIYGKYDDYRQSPYDSNLDFEYEDQGAAAGELYAEEDNAKLLAANPSEIDDEAVRQLHQLRSSIKDNHQKSAESSRNAQIQTSHSYPTQTSKLQQIEV